MNLTSYLMLALAGGLSLIIGAEREYYAKAAGMRTTVLVGMGAALFTLLSREGVWMPPGSVTTNADGARVAAQVVTGIGFLGAGLIFVRRDSVRGLTTAASIWYVAAVGMTAGAELPYLAIFATFMYLIVAVGLRPLTRILPHSKSTARSLRVSYVDGKGVLRVIMEEIGNRGLVVLNLQVLEQESTERDETSKSGKRRIQTVELDLRGSSQSMQEISSLLLERDGVLSVHWQTHDDGD